MVTMAMWWAVPWHQILVGFVRFGDVKYQSATSRTQKMACNVNQSSTTFQPEQDLSHSVASDIDIRVMSNIGARAHA